MNFTHRMEAVIKDEAEAVVDDIKRAFESSTGSTKSAPRKVSGDLARSLRVEKARRMVYKIGVDKSQDAKALTLEFGRRSSPQSDHPFLRPAINRKRKGFSRVIKNRLKRR